MFEVVYTLNDWYDGPRRGIADYQGTPHLFESQWQDLKDLDPDSFLLTPIDSETLALALENWSIWRRWRTAFDKGIVTIETHPAMPNEQKRHLELKSLLKVRLVIDPVRAIRKAGDFRTCNASDQSDEQTGFEVHWKDPDSH